MADKLNLADWETFYYKGVRSYAYRKVKEQTEINFGEEKHFWLACGDYNYMNEGEYFRLEREIDNYDKKLIITDSSDNTKLSIDKNLDRIEKALESVMDSNSEEMTDLLDKIVYMVNVVDERKFIFRLRYDKDRIGSISCETSGRKNFARINLSDTEGASEEVPDIHIIYIKKSCNMQKLCRLQSLTRSNSLKRTSITVM